MGNRMIPDGGNGGCGSDLGSGVLRRELHAVLAKLEDSQNVNECILISMESLRLDAAESKTGWDKSEEENARLRQENA